MGITSITTLSTTRPCNTTPHSLQFTMNKILVALLVALALAQLGDAKRGNGKCLCRKMFLSAVKDCTAEWVACSATDKNEDVKGCDVKKVNACVLEAAAEFNKEFGYSTKCPECAKIVGMYREAFGMVTPL